MPPVVVDSILASGFVVILVFWSWAEFIFDRAVKPFLIQDPTHPSRPSLQGFWWPTRAMAHLWMGSTAAKQELLTWEEKMVVVRRHRHTGLLCAAIILVILLTGLRQGMLEDRTWFPGATGATAAREPWL